MRKKLNRKEEETDSSVQYILENLTVDKFRLEIEAEKQTDLMYQCSKLLVAAKDATLKAKNHLEIVEFEMMQDIRKNLKKYELTKDTDTVVSKAVKATPEYKRAFSNYLFIKKKEDEYALLMDNVRQRYYLIKMLADLWMNNYYSDPQNYEVKRKKPAILKPEERE